MFCLQTPQDYEKENSKATKLLPQLRCENGQKGLNMRLPKCKYCGSDKGYFTNIKGTQDYLCNGEPCGAEIETFIESKLATCYGCGKKVLLSDLLKGKCARMDGEGE